MSAPDVARVRAELDRADWSRLPGTLPPEACARAIDWIARAAAAAPSALEPEYEPATAASSRRVRKLRRLLWHDPAFWRPFLDEAGLLRLGAALVPGRPAVVFHAAFLKPAGGSAVALHQDQALWNYDYPGAATLWIALSRCTRDNGCLVLRPGSRRALLAHQPDPAHPWHPSIPLDADGLGPPLEVPMEQGDALAWRRFLPHSSGPNAGAQPRLGMVLVFVDASAAGFAARDLLPVPPC